MANAKKKFSLPLPAHHHAGISVPNCNRKSSVAKKTLSPNWDLWVETPVAEGKIARKKEDDEEEEEEEDPDKSPMLELQVWDRDKLDDDFMGRVGIVL